MNYQERKEMRKNRRICNGWQPEKSVYIAAAYPEEQNLYRNKLNRFTTLLHHEWGSDVNAMIARCFK